MGGPNLCPTTPHPITGEKVPLTFGHEFSAIVTEIGEGVSGFKEGDRVAVEVCLAMVNHVPIIASSPLQPRNHLCTGFQAFFTRRLSA